MGYNGYQYITGNVNVASTTNPIQTVFDDAQSDSFGRFRVSSPVSVFQGKTLYIDRGVDYVERLTGAASSSLLTYSPIKRLTVPNGVTGSAIRQTRCYQNYQTGKSQQILITFNMGENVSGSTQRVGYFDNDNGIFLEHSLSGTYMCVRSNTSGVPIDNAVSQSQWNLDKLDGAGHSGISLDLTKSQILVIDFEWLGVGVVRTGFVIDGLVYHTHKFYWSNEQTGVYMATPNLPPRWELNKTQTSGAVNLDAICCSVASEGGVADDILGRAIAIDRGVTTFQMSIAMSTTLRPLISVRTTVAATRMNSYPEQFSVLCTSTSTNGFKWTLLLNPTVLTGTAASWVSASSASGLEYDISQDGEVSGGISVASGYGIGTAISSLSWPVFPLGASVTGTRDIYVLAVQQFSAANETYVANLLMREVI